jgi:beta-lactam-binding protein with PASTA domain
MKEKIPDVTAYRLDEAINILEKKGIKFNLKKTIPPLSGLEDHKVKEISKKNYRVVKQMELEDYTLELIIVAE